MLKLPDEETVEVVVGEKVDENVMTSKLRSRLDKFAPEEIRNRLIEKGLSTDGDKQELVDRLVKSLENFEVPEDILSSQERLRGYCIRWIMDKGLVIDEETGEEYPAHGEDLMSVDQKMLHCFESVEFCVLPNDEGEKQAKYITKPGSEKVKHSWRPSQRRGREAAVSEQRYVGYVERFDKHHGFIVFKHKNFRDIYFPAAELQTTGIKTVPPGAEVEFTVGVKDRKKQARHITRVGGGLMTVEGGILGKFLRNNNVKVEDKEELQPPEPPTELEEIEEGIVEPFEELRLQGIVGDWFPNSDMGMIWPTNGCKTIQCKAVDIVSTGIATLRRNTEVEFTVEKGEDGQILAKRVTGPGGDPYIDALPGPVYDHLASLKKSFSQQDPLEIDPMQIHRGWVKVLTNNDELGYIVPDDPEGRRHVEFTYHQIHWEGPGFPTIKVNEPVEFRTCSWDDGTVRAIKITQVGGEPFRPTPEQLAKREELLKQKQKRMNPKPSTETKKEDQKEEGGSTETRKRKREAEPVVAKRQKTNSQPEKLKARPRPEGKQPLQGFIVDFNLPSLKGILQPLAGDEGGENKDLLPFDVSQLQCEGFRGVVKWQVAEFTLGEVDGQSRAEFITGKGNLLLHFDENELLQRERYMIEAHQIRMEAQMRAQNAPHQPPRNWIGGNHPPMGGPFGGMPFPPMDPYFHGPPMHWGGPPPPHFWRGRGRRGGWRGRGRGRGRRGRGRRGRGRDRGRRY